MDEFKIGDSITAKLDQPSIFHNKVGVITGIYSEHILLVDFGVKQDGKNVTVATMTYAMEKVNFNWISDY